jgi:phosphomethylpyrimidine synthase
MGRICQTECGMEITQQIRDFAKEKGLDTEEAVAAGLTSKSDEFADAGGEIYS